MALLEARGLVKRYGHRTVVNGVGLDVNAGEVVGLLGANGAGKTTTFRMTAGMIAPLAGTVTFSQQDITHKPMYQRARLGLGYLAQDSSVFRKLTVEQNLYAVLQLMTYRRGKRYRSTSRQRRDRVDELLNQFGLSRLRKSIALTLSGGERRRLEIARCLLSEPMLIMLDEPFTGIDPITVQDIQRIISELRGHGIGVLITDHHVQETLRITDRSYVIHGGEILAHGTPIRVILNRKVQQAYLGDIEVLLYSMREELRIELPKLITELVGIESKRREAEECILGARQHAIEHLLRAMESPDPNLRTLSHRLLCAIRGVELVFNSTSDATTRARQIQRIRESLALRQAC